MFPDYRPVVFKPTELSKIKEYIDIFGYVVARLTLDPNSVIKQFLEDTDYESLEQLWDQATDLYSNYGLSGGNGLSQCDAAWMVRNNNELKAIYKYLLQTEELVVSMDAIGLSGNVNPMTELNINWLHRDQHTQIEPSCKWNSYQSIYYVTSNNFKNAAATALSSGSHLLDFSVDEQNASNHFVRIIAHQPDNTVKIIMEPGEVLIYNSKTVHQGLFGTRRLCFMVSYGKKSDRTEQVRRDKVKMYIAGQRTTHWSQLAIPHGYKGESRYLPTLNFNDKINITDMPELTSYIFNEYVDTTSKIDWYRPELEQLIPNERLQLL